MRKILLFALAVAVICGYLAHETRAQAPTRAQTQAVVTATKMFLDSLSTDQREKVQFPFAPQKTGTIARFARSGGGPGGPGGGGRPGGPDGAGKQFGRGPGDGGGGQAAVAVAALDRAGASSESSMARPYGLTSLSVTCRAPACNLAA
jgi:hypothetical protein